jgi:hypothetical protein
MSFKSIQTSANPGFFATLCRFFCGKSADHDEELPTPTDESIHLNGGFSTPKSQHPAQSGFSKKTRDDLAKDFIEDKGLELGCEFDQLDEGAKIRLRELMSNDYSWSPTKSVEKKEAVTTFAEEYKGLLETQPFWKSETQPFSESDTQPSESETQPLFFFEEKDIEKYMVIRKQNGGVCYMHAVVVFVHYIQAIRSDAEPVSDFL